MSGWLERDWSHRSKMWGDYSAASPCLIREVPRNSTKFLTVRIRNTKGLTHQRQNSRHRQDSQKRNYEKRSRRAGRSTLVGCCCCSAATGCCSDDSPSRMGTFWWPLELFFTLFFLGLRAIAAKRTPQLRTSHTSNCNPSAAAEFQSAAVNFALARITLFFWTRTVHPNEKPP